jgi:hypothetical protein
LKKKLINNKFLQFFFLLLIAILAINKSFSVVHSFSHLAEITDSQNHQADKNKTEFQNSNQKENQHSEHFCDQCLAAKFSNFFSFSAVNFSLNYFIFSTAFLILANQEIFNLLSKKLARAPPFIVL